jgi:hypothetical protein
MLRPFFMFLLPRAEIQQNLKKNFYQVWLLSNWYYTILHLACEKFISELILPN